MNAKPSSKRGFTLVELLVVITIVAALAALALGMANRGMAKAKGAKAISNMRQLGSLLGTYAGDNNNRLPPARADIQTSSGAWEQLHWFESLATLLHPDLEPATWRNKKWWQDNKPVLLNPLIDETSKPFAHDWWNPGYAMNRQIIVNLAIHEVHILDVIFYILNLTMQVSHLSICTTIEFSHAVKVCTQSSNRF